MRLSKIKLAGFKSFVDPTTIYLPSNLVGVVGPNGCGKSNVIDAIRWVMGETSARNLRGDSMEDVIFNGSSSRQPVGSASIELFFDNSDGAIGGQFASYAEISIRRLVSRDDTSSYFLNNTRCRRKDITNLFLGTGLGPRSYAIIEQGMVSRLVDAKPEEMRVFLEEAAGISKYKERRRETENRMHHTRENLARLNDLREEIEKQIKHLQRQANVAERYKGLKQQERQLEAELFAIRLRELDRSLGAQRVDLAEKQTGMDAALAGQRQVEANIERARAQHVEASDAFSATQATYYSVQSEISRLEQTLAHTRELRERQAQDLQHAEDQLAEIDAEMGRDGLRLDHLEADLAGFAPNLATARAAQADSAVELQHLEEALAAWQNDWHGFNLDVKEHQQTQQVEHTRLEHLEANRERLGRQLESAEGERDSISVVDLEARLAAQMQAEDQAAGVLRAETGNLDSAVQSLSRQREDEQRFGADIEHLRGEIESRRGRLDTLRAIQDAALDSDEDLLSSWLDKHGLTGKSRVVHDLEVAEPWTRAVETVLGDFLQAICVDGCDELAGALPDTSVILLESGNAGTAGSPAGTLAEHVRNAGHLYGMLVSVRCAGSLDKALRLRQALQPGDSVITPDGVWLGSGWVRVSRGQRYAGVIAREQEIRELSDAIADLDTRMADIGRGRAEARREIEALEGRRVDIQGRIADANRQCLESGVVLSSLRQELERAHQRLVALGTDCESVRNELVSLATTIEEARRRREAAEAALAVLEARRPGLRQHQETLLASYNAGRQHAEESRAAVAQIMIEYESRRAAREAAGIALERVSGQRGQLVERIDALRGQIADSGPPLVEHQHELDRHLAHEVEVQQQLGRCRETLEAVEIAVRTDENRRLELEKHVAGHREALDALRLQVRESEVRREALAERFGATGLVLDEVQAQVRADAEAEEWDTRLAQVRASVERLGPVNLAAIDEFTEQSERKTYLDAQHADLCSALETLEHAIRKIDRETRTRFQETFDNVNNGLKRIFPRLFGGGHAYLSMEGDDLLSAGVTVMARPPGKRNSHIHLLSGGEKALTAVALIFSIFELNPAPFCLLDEVDAPLDEANVGRFCDIVREMSKAVQFVVITHNKTTMEMVSQLTGVTMNEPGVSRLVAVDIDEAVKLAAS